MLFPELVVGELNRAENSRTDLSGKGVNVSVALSRFGIDSVLTGFCAGVYGRILDEGLCDLGYECDFVEVDGETRSNVTVIDGKRGVTTKLNEPGPTVTAIDIEALEKRMSERLRVGDTCIFSGSLAPGAPNDTYARLIRVARSKGATTALDTSGAALIEGCAAHPDCVKPNAIEAMQLVDQRDLSEGYARDIRDATTDDETLVRVLGAIHSEGPSTCLLTLGSRGAAFSTQATPTSRSRIWHGRPPRITEVSAVGAGDASLAGMLWARCEGLPDDKVVRWAVASGTAAAMGEGSAMPSLDRIRDVYQRVEVTCLA